MIHGVQKMDAEAVLVAQRVEQLRREVEILFRRPDLFLGQALAGRLVKKLAPGDAISRLQSGHARLGPHCLVAELEIMGDGADGFRNVAPVGVAVDQRSEEHTSELQSLMRSSYAVFCLKKKIRANDVTTI